MDTNDLLTNRELSEWLAKGNGEVTYSEENHPHIVTTVWKYQQGTDTLIPSDLYVRKWGYTEWNKPTIDYCWGRNEV